MREGFGTPPVATNITVCHQNNNSTRRNETERGVVDQGNIKLRIRGRHLGRLMRRLYGEIDLEREPPGDGNSNVLFCPQEPTLNILQDV